MSKLGTITRRTFMFGSVAIVGGVAFGYYKYKSPIENPIGKDLSDDEAAITPYVLIDKNGISIIAPRGEMGQGIHTTLAAMVAEELDVTLDQVTVMHGPASAAYFNAAVLEETIPFASIDTSSMANNVRKFVRVPAKLLGMQITGGSSSVSDGMGKMRVAGAAAREVLLKAAAKRLNVPLHTLTTNKGQVVSEQGTTLSYQELAPDTIGIEPSKEQKLKPKSEWKILGKSQARIDVVAKSTGTAEYGVDIELPNMLFASIKVNPHLGSSMNSFDASDAKAMQGVEKVIGLDNGAAVIATNTWYAFKAVNAIKFDWADANYPASNAEHLEALKNSFTDDYKNSQLRDDGDVEETLKEGTIISGEYQVPYLAHAPMEPMNATAWFHDGILEIWAGNQIPTQVIKDAVAITGLDESKIKLHSLIAGGSFGRRLELDYVSQAIRIAQAVSGTPIKLTWTREEETTHDYYRPMAIGRFKAIVDENGPTSIDLQLAAASVTASQMGRIGIPAAGPDMLTVQAAWDQPYGIENFRVTGYHSPIKFPVSSWRSVGSSQNGFFMESMMDELAHSANLDPMEMRIKLMTHLPSRKVLEAVRDLSNWGEPLPEGHGRGVAYSLSFGVPAAEVVEVQVTDGRVKILKVYAAVDVGTALDPRNIESQVMSGINFGLAAAMMGEITVEDAKVQQTNFHMFNSMRINQAPDIQVAILENNDRIRGIGEPGTPPAAPALANAIFAATGKRIRELPLNKHVSFL